MWQRLGAGMNDDKNKHMTGEELQESEERFRGYSSSQGWQRR